METGNFKSTNCIEDLQSNEDLITILNRLDGNTDKEKNKTERSIPIPEFGLLQESVKDRKAIETVQPCFPCYPNTNTDPSKHIHDFYDDIFQPTIPESANNLILYPMYVSGADGNPEDVVHVSKAQSSHSDEALESVLPRFGMLGMAEDFDNTDERDTNDEVVNEREESEFDMEEAIEEIRKKYLDNMPTVVDSTKEVDRWSHSFSSHSDLEKAMLEKSLHASVANSPEKVEALEQEAPVFPIPQPTKPKTSPVTESFASGNLDSIDDDDLFKSGTPPKHPPTFDRFGREGVLEPILEPTFQQQELERGMPGTNVRQLPDHWVTYNQVNIVPRNFRPHELFPAPTLRSPLRQHDQVQGSGNMYPMATTPGGQGHSQWQSRPTAPSPRTDVEVIATQFDQLQTRPQPNHFETNRGQGQATYDPNLQPTRNPCWPTTPNTGPIYRQYCPMCFMPPHLGQDCLDQDHSFQGPPHNHRDACSTLPGTIGNPSMPQYPLTNDPRARPSTSPYMTQPNTQPLYDPRISYATPPSYRPPQSSMTNVPRYWHPSTSAISMPPVPVSAQNVAQGQTFYRPNSYQNMHRHIQPVSIEPIYSRQGQPTNYPRPTYGAPTSFQPVPMATRDPGPAMNMRYRNQMSPRSMPPVSTSAQSQLRFNPDMAGSSSPYNPWRHSPSINPNPPDGMLLFAH